MVGCAKDPRPVETTYFAGVRKAGLFAVEVNRPTSNQTASTVPLEGRLGGNCCRPKARGEQLRRRVSDARLLELFETLLNAARVRLRSFG